MTQAQYSDFMEAILPAYVAERAAADHVSAEVANRYARHQHARLLPEGHRTTGHRFLRMVSTDSDESVGGVWFWIDVENKTPPTDSSLSVETMRRKRWQIGRAHV